MDINRRIKNNDFLRPMNLYLDTYNHYYNLLSNLLLTIFEWNNIPEYIPVEWIEKILNRSGKCIAFIDDNLGFMITEVTETGQLNIFEQAISYNALGINFNKEILLDNCVIIKNNPLNYPTYSTISLFSTRLTNIKLTMDINLYGQRNPLLIAVDEKQRLTWENILAKYDGFGYVIKGEKNILSDIGNEFKVINLQSPFIMDKLREQLYSEMNEILTFLGINNASMVKRTRLVSDEANINFEQVDMSAQIMLKSRQDAIKLINSKFNMNISVSMRKYSEESVKKILGLYNNDFMNYDAHSIDGKSIVSNWNNKGD